MNEFLPSSNTVAAGALASPWWVPFIEGLNGPLTTVLTLLGIILALIKIYQATIGKDD